jgi:hypothetical protein
LVRTQKHIDQHVSNSGTDINLLRFFAMAEIQDHRPAGPSDKPIAAVAEQGVVLVDGPGGVAITLTSAAASDSARSMAQAADAADQQSMPAATQR